MAVHSKKAGATTGGLALGLLLLSGCMGVYMDGSDEDRVQAQVLAGADSNFNSVRDDVEVQIGKLYPVAHQKSAALQVARIYQRAVQADPQNLAEVQAISFANTLAVNCLYASFDKTMGQPDPLVVFEEIRSMSLNTDLRLRAYLKFNRVLESLPVSPLPNGDTCIYYGHHDSNVLDRNGIRISEK